MFKCNSRDIFTVKRNRISHILFFTTRYYMITARTKAVLSSYDIIAFSIQNESILDANFDFYGYNNLRLHQKMGWNSIACHTRKNSNTFSKKLSHVVFLYLSYHIHKLCQIDQKYKALGTFSTFLKVYQAPNQD